MTENKLLSIIQSLYDKEFIIAPTHNGRPLKLIHIIKICSAIACDNASYTIYKLNMSTDQKGSLIGLRILFNDQTGMGSIQSWNSSDTYTPLNEGEKPITFEQFTIALFQFLGYI